MTRESELTRCLRNAVDCYFRDLEGEKPGALYEMVINCVEKPLIEMILQRVEGNQTQAAEILGINRSTLRKKINAHGIKG